MADPVSLLAATLVANAINSAATGASSASAYAPRQIAAQRTLPGAAEVAVMKAVALGAVNMDGDKLPLAPGAQIKNELNMLVMPNMVRTPVKVKYLSDGFGYVSRVWILSATEIAALP